PAWPRTMPRSSRAWKTEMISSRPVLARWPGKNPRLPTTTPNVIARCAAISCSPSYRRRYSDASLLLSRRVLLACASWTKLYNVEQPEERQNAAPPNRRVQLGQLDQGRIASGLPFIDAIAESHSAIDQQQHSNKEPDGN